MNHISDIVQNVPEHNTSNRIKKIYTLLFEEFEGGRAIIMR